MSTAGDPVPQRIGDAERDRAVELLRDHLAEGRLDTAEFDERLTAALSAKTAGDLEPLFTDLPGPRPGQAVIPTAPYAAPPWQTTPAVPAAPVSAPLAAHGRHGVSFNSLAGVISAFAWTATVMLISFGPGWDYWWLLFIPMVVSSVLGKERQDRERQRLEQTERQKRLEKDGRQALGD